jgi:hypothetical protein
MDNASLGLGAVARQLTKRYRPSAERKLYGYSKGTLSRPPTVYGMAAPAPLMLDQGQREQRREDVPLAVELR